MTPRGNYYNEIDPYAAQWLRNLIDAGHIAAGVVDERSIEDVKPSDLIGYAQCHFFAGIGIWPLALRRAGWPDNRSIWTGSCPCQPFSQTGEGGGFADERHLWPAFFHLITQYNPECVVGEQVASSDADPWLDLVHTDMENLGYAFGAVAYPAAGIGSPNIRDRTYWAALAAACRLDHANGARLEGYAGYGGATEWQRPERPTTPASISVQLAAPGPTNGLWRDADWLSSKDGKWRAVERGTFPLVDGDFERVGRLRAYGNAINAEQARIFIEALMCTTGD